MILVQNGQKRKIVDTKLKQNIASNVLFLSR